MRKIDYWEGSNQGDCGSNRCRQSKNRIPTASTSRRMILKPWTLEPAKRDWKTAKAPGIKFDIVPDTRVDNGIQTGTLMVAPVTSFRFVSSVGPVH